MSSLPANIALRRQRPPTFILPSFLSESSSFPPPSQHSSHPSSRPILIMKFFMFALAGLAAAQHAHPGPFHFHHHIDFERFTTGNCTPGTEIGHTYSLKQDQCTTPHVHHKAAVVGVRATVTNNYKQRIGREQNCRVILYSEEQCKGTEVRANEMWHQDTLCTSIKSIEYRSATLKCWKAREGPWDSKLVVEEDEVNEVNESDQVLVGTTNGAQGQPAQALTLQQSAVSVSDALFLTGSAESKSMVTIHVPVSDPTPQVLTIQQQPEPKPVVTVQQQPEAGTTVTVHRHPHAHATTVHHPHAHVTTIHRPNAQVETVKVVTLTVPFTKEEAVHWATITTTMGLSEFLARQTATAKLN
ncbi:hypothetical protein BST61_g8119 [Cercospora zeina]